MHPLTPLQAGMLYHHLANAQVGRDIVQLVCTLRESLDMSCLIQAWQWVTNRHHALRSCCRWEGLDRPMLEIRDSAEIEAVELDLRGMPPTDQAARIDAFLAEDRGRGFDLARSPLHRLECIRTADSAHTIIWTFHHVIIDGRSLPIILREIFAVYDALLVGATPTLLPPKDHSMFLDWIARRNPDTAETFWRDELGNCRASPLLPFDRVYDRAHSEHGANRGNYPTSEVRLTRAQTDALRALAATHDVTVNTIVQAAWGLLLARHSGEDEALFGATRACRRSTVPGAEDMVGMFINTLPQRIITPPDLPLPDLLRQLRGQHLALRAVEHTPLSRIREWLGVPGTIPLFESLYSFETRDLQTELSNQGGEWAAREFRLIQQTGYPLTAAASLGRELVLRICVDVRRVGADAASRIGEQWSNLLQEYLSDPTGRLGEFSLASAAERRQMLVDWNNTYRDYPRDRRVEELFEEQARCTPELPALVGEDRQDTYRQLNDRADAVARWLRAQGIQAGQPVGLWGPRSADAVVAWLGILKACATCVPLAFDAPAPRIKATLAGVGVELVLAVEPCPWSDESGIPRVVEVAAARRDGCASPEFARHGGSADRAYVLHTSGTTGTPKGASVTHRALVNLLCYRTGEQFQPGDFQVAALTAPLHFDASLVQILSPLLTGGTLVALRDIDQLIASPWYHRLTAFTAAPSLVAQLIDQPGLPESAKVIGLGAEPVPPELLRRLESCPTVERVLVAYGVTECTCYSTAGVLHAKDSHDSSGRGQLTGAMAAGHSHRIGRPIANTRVYVLDPHGQLAPVGFPGELYIAGDGVAEGYVGQPALTAQRFLPDPFQPGETMYRTGDRARWLADGSLEFLGRLDDQVKVRGQRVELGEIESLLASHPAVSRSVALLRDQPPGEKQLVAYWIASGESVLSVTELREHLARWLPRDLLPYAFVRVESFPTTSTGKVDRTALPAPEQPSEPPGQTGPRSDSEQSLAAMWEDVLGLEQVGIDDDFFELGGHSLLAMKLLARIERAFGKTPPLQTLIAHPTVRRLAAILDGPLESFSRPSLVLVRGPLDLKVPPRPAMVIVPSRDGHFDKWRSLLTVVARDRAVHGLEVVGGQPYWMENPSLEEIAEGFTRLLIERSPRQGFHLFGYSFGGVLAYEIGRQLAEHGLPPLSVTLLDSVANAGPAPWRLRDAASMAANAPRLWIFNMRTYPARNVARRAARLMCFWRWWRRSRLSAEMPEKAEAEERPSINGELPSLYRQRRAVAARALCAYRPRPTGNRIVYVRSRVRRLIHRRSADGGWGRLVPDHALTIRHLSGNHVSALEPQRQRELAVIIEECLRNVDQSAQSPSSRKAA